MSSTVTTGEVLTLPAGVKHYSTTAQAVSWAAYDALDEDAGWVRQGLLHKVGRVDGCLVTVIPPWEPREYGLKVGDEG